MKKNNEASMKNLETQIGQLSKQISERSSGGFPARTVDNPKNETCNAISSRSGMELEYEVAKKKGREELEQAGEVVENDVVVEKESETRREQLKGEASERPKVIPAYMRLPYPPAPKRNEKEGQLSKFKNEEVVALTEECSAIIQNKLPQKLKDPGSFTLPCTIGDKKVEKALCDLGASINLMPLAMWRKLGKGEIKPTNMTLRLADRSIRDPYGIAEDVLVKVGNFLFPVDFVILKLDGDTNVKSSINGENDVPFILGRPFLATSRAVIDVADGTVKLRVRDECVTFNVLESTAPAKVKEECYDLGATDSSEVEKQEKWEVQVKEKCDGLGATNSKKVEKKEKWNKKVKEKSTAVWEDMKEAKGTAGESCTKEVEYAIGVLKEALRKLKAPPEPN